MCSAKEFPKEEKKERCCFVVIPKGLKVNHPMKNFLTKVRRVLPEFKGIMVDEMPTRLLLTRSISHQIDLIPGSSLPNKAQHRMTLAKNVELN